MGGVTRLRLLQLGCIVLFLSCMALIYWRRNPAEVPLGTRHWIVIVGVVWSAASGFTIQRRIVKGRPRRSSRSTPFTRWRAGHIIRLWTATSLGFWAVVLSDWGGPRLVVNAFFAIGLVLLLIWSPGPAPPETQSP